MAIKVVNNSVILDDGTIVADKIRLGNINDQPTVSDDILVHDGNGNVTLQNVTVDTATVTFGGSTFNTDIVPEGSINLYYTDARFDTRFDTKNTDALPEGINNRYFTVSRENNIISAYELYADQAEADAIAAANAYTDAVVSSGTGSLTTDEITEGATNLYYTDARVDANFNTKTTDALLEGTTNLYYTDARVRTVLAADAIATQAYVDAAVLTKDNTDEITEGATNLYYTDARVDANFNTKTTDALLEGTTNLYYTDARVDANFNTKNTDALLEGTTNLYYTDERARNAISASGSLLYDPVTGVISYTTPTTIASLSNHTTDSLLEGSTNLYFTTARFSSHFDLNLLTKNTDDLVEGATNLYFTNERVDDRVASLLLAGDNIALTYNDTVGTITIDSVPNGGYDLSENNSDDLIEGTTNLYFTNERVDDRVANLLVAGNNITLTYNDVSGTITIDAASNGGYDLSGNSTDDLTEGATNLYYTDARVRSVLTSDSIANTSYVDQAELDAVTTANAYTDSVVATATGSLTSDNINEGTTNLYYTDSRVDSNFATKTTTNLAEGTNLYFTNTRARNAISASGDLSYNSSTGVISYTTPTTIASLSNHTTTNLAEGTNLYYTDARVGTYLTTNSYATETYVNNALSSQASAGYDLSSNSTDDLTEGATNLYFTDERVDDRVANLLVAGTNVSLIYNDVAGTITINAASNGGYDLSGNSTDDLTEGATNLYYTNARARGAISVTGSGTYNSTTGVINIEGGVTSVNSQTGAVTLTTSNIAEGTNLYYTSTRATSAARSAISVSGSLSYNSSTGVISYTTPTTIASLSNHTTTNLAEGTNLYFTDARARSAISASGDLSYNPSTGVISYTIPTTIASLSNHTTDALAEGSTNLYYTTARANSAIDTRVTKTYVDALGIEAASVAANSVSLGTDTTGNYVATITGSTNEIEVTGSGTESATVTIGLPSDVTITNNLTVGGDLFVTGSTVTVGASNLSVDDNFIYLNQGDAIDPVDITFTGTGIDDMLFTGYYKGASATTYYIKIDSTGTPDTFAWSKDNFSTTEASNIAITGGDQLLDNGISVQFTATTGHTLNDTWSATANPIDIDTGIFTNRNTGTTGPGYTHQGIFFDVSTNKWRIFSEYDKEPNGDIDTAHASYVAGTFVADTFEGNLTGNAATATKLATARTISLSGDATGSVSFDGSANATITVAVANNSHNHSIANIDGLTSYTNMLDSATSGATNGTIAVRHFSTGNISATSFTGALIGNASTASALQTARTIALTGDVTGSVNFDGSANVSITTAVANNSHTHTSTTITDFAEAVQDTVGAAIVGANAIDATYDDGLGTITISHTDTSTATSLTALTGANVISDIDIDTYGHVTALATRALTPANIGAAAASHTHTSANITDFAEAVQDIIGADVVAGTGISVSYNDTTGNTTITNTSPDQTVTITGGGATSVSGTYPNFTISSTNTNTTYSAGTGISLGGTTFSLNLNSLSTSTADADGDYFAVVDTLGAQRKLTKANINLSGFNNDAGWTSNTGTVTSVAVSAGTGLSGGGTVTTSGTISLALNFAELTDMTTDISGATEFILQNGTVESRKAASEIKLSAFNNDAGWTSNTGTVTSVAAGSYLTGGTITTTGTLAVDATSANTASKVVARDASGNFSAGTITAALSGNASTATKLATARTISLSGDATGSVSFDGSANATITVAVANDSHDHTYLKAAGSTKATATTTGISVTGSLIASGDVESESGAIYLNGWNIDATAFDTIGTVYYSNAIHNFTGTITGTLSGNASTATKLATARTIGGVSFDGSANINLPGVNVAGNQNTSGNAATATTATQANKWTTARTITLGGDLSGSVSIDGSANVTLSGQVANDSHDHTYLKAAGSTKATATTTGVDVTGNAIASGYLKSTAGNLELDNWGIDASAHVVNNTVYYSNAIHNFTGTITGTLNGNASTATKLATARTISLSGDATGSTTFDGSANATITVAVANDSHNHTYLYNGSNIKATATTTGVDVTGNAIASGYLKSTAGNLELDNWGIDASAHVVNNTVYYSNAIHTFTGEVVSTGEVTAYSDRRFKHNIVTIENALDKVVALRGVNYEKDDRYSMGVIAQEVEEVIPEVVHTDAEGMKSVAYGNIVGVLIEAIKEQQHQIEDLKKQLDELKK